MVRVVVRVSCQLRLIGMGKARSKRQRGQTEVLPSGSLQVSVFVGINSTFKDRVYLRDTVPAGPRLRSILRWRREPEMGNTDFERELRATQVEAGSRAPVGDLAGRAAAPVRRRRTWLASGFTVTAMAVVGIAVAVTAPSGSETAGGSTTNTSASMPTQADGLVSTWRPVDIVGFDDSRLPPSGVQAPEWNVTFTSDGRWQGTDGCNAIGGTYRAGDDGSISVDVGGPQHLIGCGRIPTGAVLGRAARFAVDGPSLIVYATAGQRLGSYERV